MDIIAVPNGDGTFRYRDEAGNFMSHDDAIKAAHTPDDGFFSQLSNAVSGAAAGVTSAVQNIPDTTSQVLSGLYKDYFGTNADNTAQVQDAAYTVGTDPASAINLTQETQRKMMETARAAQMDDPNFEGMPNSNPSITQYLLEPLNMQKSYDDVPALKMIENVARTMTNSYALSSLEQQRGDFGQSLKKSGRTLEEATEDEKEQLEDLDNQIKAIRDKASVSPWSIAGVAGAIAGMVPQWLEGLQAVPAGIAAGVATGAVTGAEAGALAGPEGALAGAAALGAEGAAVGAQVGFANAFADKVSGNKFLDEQLKGIDAKSAAIGSDISGALTMGLSLPMVASWMKIPQMAKDSGLLKQLGVQTLENSFIGAGMTASDIAGSKYAEGGLSDWDAQDIDSVLEGGIDMIPVSLAMSTPGYAWAGLHSLGKAADAAKTTSRNPEATADIINNAVEGTPIEYVKIPSNVLADYLETWSQKDPTIPTKIMDTLKISGDDLKLAMATGDDVSARVGDYSVMPEEYRDALAADAKVGSQPSAREVQELYADAQEARMEAENQKATGETGQESSENPVKVERQEEGNTGDFAKDTGITELPSYQKALEDAKKISPEADTPEESAALAEHIKRTGDALKKEVEQEPLYQAEKMFDFNLQLFGTKDVKDLALKYKNGELSTKQEAYFDTVADQHGFESGDALAEAIRKNRLADDEVSSRLDTAIRIFKNDNGIGAEIKAEQAKASPELLKASAMESAALKNAAAKIKIVKQARENYLGPKGQKKMQAFIAAEGRDAIRMAIKSTKEKDMEKKAAQLERKKEKTEARIQAIKDRYAGKIGDIKAKDAKELAGAKEKLATIKADMKQQKIESDTALAEERQKAKDTVDKRLARNGDILVSEARTYAKNAMGSVPAGKAIRYRDFLALADSAKKAAESYYRKGEYDTAASWKNKEVTCRAMAVEAVSAYKEFTKRTQYLKRTQGASAKSYGDERNFNQAANLLDRFGYSRKDFNPKARSESLSDWAVRMREETGTVLIDDWLYNEADKKAVTDLTLPQIKSLTEALKNIKTVSRQATNLIQAKRGADFTQARDAMITELNRKADKYELNSNRNSFKAKLANVVGELKTMETTVGKLQQWRNDGSLSDFWLRSVNDAANKESDMVRSLTGQYKKIWAKYSAKELYALSNKKISIPEIGVTTTKDKLLGVGLNLGNQTNMERVTQTRPLEFIKATRWDEPTIRNILQKYLTEKDWNTIQETWNLLEGMWPTIAEHHRALTGFSPEKVEPTPFNVISADGKKVSMAGGYFPLKKDTRVALQSAINADTDSALYTMNNSPMFISTKKGYLKARTNAAYAVSLDPGIMLQHVLDVVHDIYFRGLVSDFSRMGKDPLFQTTLFSKGGDAAIKAFGDYVRTIAGSSYREVGKSALESVINWERRAASNAAISFRLGVITQNISNGLLYAGAMPGFGHVDATMAMIRYGLFDYLPRAALDWRGQNKFKKDIFDKSSFMKDWDQRPEYTLWEAERNAYTLGPKTMLGKVSEFSQHLMHFTDELTALPMWKQAYSNQLKLGKSQEDAIYYADSLIRRVNGSGRTYDQSKFIRDDRMSIKIINSFMGFMNTELNRWMREAGMASQSIPNIPRFIAFVGSRMFMFTLVSNLMAGHTPDEKDDPVKWYLSNAVSYPFSMIPVVKDVAPTMISSMFGVKTYGYRPPITFSSLENLTQFASSVQSYTKNTGRTSMGDVAEKGTKALSYLTGFPDQLNAWFWNAYDYQINGMNAQVTDIFSRRAKNERR